MLLNAKELKSTPSDVFDLLEKVGEGSYGSVFKGLHKRTGTICAIKIVYVEDDSEEWEKECETLRGCTHSGIVEQFASYSVTESNELWIVMEYCGAGSLLDVMKISGECLAEHEIRHVCQHTLQALAYLHENGRIHRDIKAANILLTLGGTPKLGMEMHDWQVILG